MECGSNPIIALVGERDSWISYINIVQRFGQLLKHQPVVQSSFSTENSDVTSFFFAPERTWSRESLLIKARYKSQVDQAIGRPPSNGLRAIGLCQTPRSQNVQGHQNAIHWNPILPKWNPHPNSRFQKVPPFTRLALPTKIGVQHLSTIIDSTRDPFNETP